MNFKLISEDYKDEVYKSFFSYNGKNVCAVVNMHYHTIKQYWHVNYRINFGKGFLYCTDVLKGVSCIQNRKEARRLADEIMQNASENDANTLISDFHRNQILRGEFDG